MTGLKIAAAEFRERPISAARLWALDRLIAFFRSDGGRKFSKKSGRLARRRDKVRRKRNETK